MAEPGAANAAVPLAPAQFADLVQAITNRLGNAGGTRVKAPRLETVEPEQFLIWRQNFADAAAVNEWGVNRAKVVARASLGGDAALLCHSIPLGADVGADAVTLNGLLDLYENRILTPAAGAMSESLFEAAVQTAGEPVSKFHGRLRSLYIRAYPARANDYEQRRDLIKKFLNGLHHPQVRLHAKAQVPATYTAAANAAEQYEAVLLSEKPSSSRGGAINSISINGNSLGDLEKQLDSMSSISAATHCIFCGRSNHLVNNCFSLQKLRALLEKFPGTAAMPPKGGRGKNNKNKNNKNKNRNNPSVNSMQESPSASGNAASEN